ncbi:MAG: tripartite tricarboxylate transporter substrate binding protein [Hyphomicrobiales bacterium]|nr:tripartite tricarboxylate transporter substrate binding protein [Hyphomicrobiales bacterium]
MLVAIVALVPSICSAQTADFPSRSIRVIVPFAAGGPTDIAARLVADRLAQRWGQSVVVENRPGGGSVTGSAAVSRAAADGYTLLFGPSSALVENSLIMRDLPYDPVEGFAPVAEIYRISAGLSINSKLPARDVPQLIALARTRSLSYSSFGIGTGPHLLLETFKRAAGVEILHVPYKGNAPGLAAVVSGEVDMTGAGLGAARPHVESGALRLLAVAGDAPSRFAPGVPTFKALGYPTVSGGSLYVGLWAPPSTPAAVIDKLNTETLVILASEPFARFLDQFGYDKASTTTPAGLLDLTRTSIEFWRPLMAAVGIKPE